MAARRLIVILLVLLAISVIAAAIAPQHRSGRFPGGVETTSTTTAPEPEPRPTGDLMEAEIAASAADPPTVRATVGEHLSLSVTSQRPLEVQIESLGLIGNASPAAPADFDVLLREPGAIAITDAASGRIVGRLLVEDRATPGGQKPQSGSTTTT